MRRWLTIFAFLVIAAMLANAECSASCFNFESPHTSKHNSACCTDHCSLAEHATTDSSHTGCQHEHSTLKYAELTTSQFDKASSFYFSDNVVVGGKEATVARTEMLASAVLDCRSDLPPEHLGRPFFSVLRI